MKQQLTNSYFMSYIVSLLKKVLEYSEKIKSFDAKQTRPVMITLRIGQGKNTTGGHLSDINNKAKEISALQKDLYEREIVSLSQYNVKRYPQLNGKQKSEFNSKASTLDYLSAKNAVLNAEKAQFNAKTSIIKLCKGCNNNPNCGQIASWTSKLNAEINKKNESLN